METIPCRGCRTELEPSATLCPICLRPRGKLEIARDFALLRELKKIRQRRPFVIMGRLLVFAAVSSIAYRYRAPLAAAAASLQARSARVFAAMEFKNLISAPPDAPTPAIAAVAAPAAPAPAAASPAPAASPAAPRVSSTTAQPQTPVAAPVEDLPIPPFDPSTQWAIYGRVYDLITLRPLEGAQLSFQFNGGSYGGGRTDEFGRFVVVLPRMSEGSYEIHGTRADYVPFVFYEPDIPYAKLSLEQRRELVRNAQGGDISLSMLTDIVGEESIHRDLFMAPRR